MAAPIEIDVWQGDIAELEVDALVVAANESLFMTGSAAASVKRNGGEQIERAAVAQGPARPGTAIATAAGGLAAAYVIHAVAVGHDRLADPDRLRHAVGSALAYCEPLQLRRIAVALLGLEHGVFRPEEAAALLVGELLTAGEPPLESVVIATAHAVETQAAIEALARLRAGV